MAVGGRTQDEKEVAVVEMYHPSVKRWLRVADLDVADSQIASASLDGVLHVVGYKTHAKYDASANEWKQIAALNEPRCGLALVELNSALYAFGGIRSAAVERYDVTRDEWTTMRPLNTAR